MMSGELFYKEKIYDRLLLNNFYFIYLTYKNLLSIYIKKW